MPELANAEIKFGTIKTERILGVTYTLTRGITPSAALLRLTPEDTEPQVGNLVLKWDNLTLTFRDCALVDAPVRHSFGRQTAIEAIVWDRRWKWRYGEISGEWNRRSCAGKIVLSTRKSVRELCQLCLTAMGEFTSALSQVPDDVYPHVKWDRANPAQELMWLCELVGCVPGIDANDETKVWRMGTGAYPDSDTFDLTDNYKAKPTVVPSTVQIATAPTVVQAKMKLEAVGLDIDGTIKPIDLLSYKPVGGWGKEWWHAFPDVDPAYRHLAEQSVWRWYRIMGREMGGWNFADIPIRVDGLNQILPIRECLAEAVDDDVGEPQCACPVISGIYWPLCDHKINTPVTARWQGEVKLRADRGIFEFEYPVIQWTSDEPAAAELYATVSFSVRDLSGDQADFSLEVPVPGAQRTTNPRIARRPDLTPVRVYDSVIWGGIAHDNQAYLLPEMQAQGGYLADTYAWPYMQTIIRGDIDRVHPDGVIAQVQWRMGNDTVPGTTIGVNTEFDTYTKAYQTRRREERLSQMGGRLWI